MYVYDGATAHYPVDGSHADLAAEFRSAIRGPHSDALRRVLQRMRAGPLAGKYVAVVRVPFREWVIGRLSGERGKPVEIVDGTVYRSLDALEWDVFRLRWKELTGVDLEP
jgi:hypothetical protein